MKQDETIDIKEVLKLFLKHKKAFIKVLVCTFILSCVWILPEPRTYTCSITLAPEVAGGEGGSLGDIAASFGINLGSMQSVDAIYPTIYPDIMESTDFVVNLFGVKVKSLDGTIDTDYYDYMANHQKKSFIKVPFKWIKNKITRLFVAPPVGPKNTDGKVHPFFLSKSENDVVLSIIDNVKCSVDKKTSVITITVTDQDRLICASLADSVRVHMQDYITNYRTYKTRIDVEHYQKLTDDALAKYNAKRKEYSNFMDTHHNVIMASVSSQQEDLENEMQLLYNQYTAFNTQLYAFQAKLQERTPAFTIIQCASVPQKATGPKRMVFVLCMLVLAFLGTSVYIYRKHMSSFGI